MVDFFAIGGRFAMTWGVMTEKKGVERLSMTKKISSMFLTLSLMAGLLTACVTSEKYEAEKARALNFQRLLAQEEKRTGELNVQLQEEKRQHSGQESQLRNLNTELEASREQLLRAQEELTRVREEASRVQEPQVEELSLSEPSISEFGLDDLGFSESEFTDLGVGDGGGGESVSHTVSKGETLFRISHQYGVTVQNLKNWNNLETDLIRIGQRLIVSQP